MIIPVSGTLSADGDGDIVKASGTFHFHAQGTFGSGTITIHYLASDGTWRPISSTAMTAAGDKLVTLTQPAKVKPVLSGSTSPTLFWEIR